MSQKRKNEGSPDGATPRPTLRRRGSLSEIRAYDEQLHDPKSEKRAFSMPKLITKTFSDPQTLATLTPIIVTALHPGISQSVSDVVKSAESEGIRQAFDGFTLEVINPIIENQNKEIEALKSRLKHSRSKTSELETEVNQIKIKQNDLEQYGRRCNIRLNNVKLNVIYIPEVPRLQTVV